jgi:hypothetical protein
VDAGVEVRALVRSVDKAKTLLRCGACGEAEGVFVGDVTQLNTLTAPMAGTCELLCKETRR